MIKQLTHTFTLNANQQQTLNGMIPFDRDDWEKQTNIRNTIRQQLRHFQNGKCCYCGLNYDETGRGEIEHIAPKKAKPIDYPEFSFAPQNLAISCQLCNSSSMKGQYNPIVVYNANYSNCTFKIVHPYLHNPEDHYKWSRRLLGVLITGISNEAQESIKLFELAGEHRTTARAKQKNHESLVALYNIPQNTLDRIKRIMNFK